MAIRVQLSMLLKTRESIEIGSCKAKSFRLWQEGAHPPPAPTPYGQLRCGLLPGFLLTEHPPDKNPGYTPAIVLFSSVQGPTCTSHHMAGHLAQAQHPNVLYLDPSLKQKDWHFCGMRDRLRLGLELASAVRC